ncbi:MAG: T9SS type A sorting domain-containing protein [Lewinellaceae bacterium]|nr:T9SS type A sorting domain-containing protein [Lewinellaceae bacterium]
MRPNLTMDRNDELYFKNEKFVGENPINESLNIAPLESTSLQNVINVWLINMTGQIVLRHQFGSGPNIPSIPTNKLPAGPYILRIDSENDIQIVKVIKI